MEVRNAWCNLNLVFSACWLELVSKFYVLYCYLNLLELLLNVNHESFTTCQLSVCSVYCVVLAYAVAAVHATLCVTNSDCYCSLLLHTYVVGLCHAWFEYSAILLSYWKFGELWIADNSKLRRDILKAYVIIINYWQMNWLQLFCQPLSLAHLLIWHTWAN